MANKNVLINEDSLKAVADVSGSGAQNGSCVLLKTIGMK